jgi:anti-anti-sigma factor
MAINQAADRVLEASVREGPAAPGVAIIDLRGDIDASAEDALNGAYVQASAGSPRIVLLNFREAGYINSTGIALIVGLLAQARKSGRRLFTTGLSDHYREIFEITRLADFMKIYPDEASALAEANES